MPTSHLDLAAIWAESVAANPFGGRVPVTVAGVLRTDIGTGCTTLVSGDRELPLLDDIDTWPLLAAVGPVRTRMFGELEAHGFRPLSLELNGQVVPV